MATSDGHDMTLKLGTRLGPYEIVGTVGAGGMGEFYPALPNEDCKC
jgi:hypothetical protein